MAREEKMENEKRMDGPVMSTSNLTCIQNGPDRSSIGTADLSRPLSSSFEADGSISSRYPSGPPAQEWWSNIDEVAVPAPADPSPDADKARSLEQAAADLGRPGGTSPVDDGNNTEEIHLSGRRDDEADKTATTDEEAARGPDKAAAAAAPRALDHLYTVSYLVLFSILGTLARLGLQALTSFPGAPVHFSSVWANFAGCVMMGFLAEDRVLFRPDRSISSPYGHPDRPSKAHLVAKKTIPLYIGLATGFCGSLTSFSAFMRDLFLAASNDLPAPGVNRPAHTGGEGFMALMAVLLVTPALSIGGLFLGAHLSLGFEQLVAGRLRLGVPARFLDRVVPGLATCAWAGAIAIAVVMPSSWPGRRVAVALGFAPPGCLLRFGLAATLNGRSAGFPVGTFAANALGTAILAGAWDSSHLGQTIGLSAVGCIILTSGVQDGFCGCLTTVSTWAAELATLRRHHGYLYGVVSVFVSLGLLSIIMGSMRGTAGFAPTAC